MAGAAASRDGKSTCRPMSRKTTLFTPKLATSQTERMATRPVGVSPTQPAVPNVMPATTTARTGEAWRRSASSHEP